MAAQRFYVIGGEYADTSFTEPAAGAVIEKHGPFSEREAKDFWRAITGKTVDNAMVRYVLKAEDEVIGKIYWVVGGEYADSNFSTPAKGKKLEVYGPFEKWEALGFWRGLTSKSVDDAMVRYDIRKNYNPDGGDEPAGIPPKARMVTRSIDVALPAGRTCSVSITLPAELGPLDRATVSRELGDALRALTA
ncbi:MAG: DUF4170 domain-containing protein [Rhodospirillaceae bacterium]|nr:DUF4170 domain-containing protein [Rhodospirillaceae bacterium]